MSFLTPVVGFVVVGVCSAARVTSASLSLARTEAKGFGPENCVGVERSQAGTCVLQTHCKKGADLEQVEFAFLCVLEDGEVQKHSYGKGGFDLEETYDSGVGCERCMLPTVALHLETVEKVPAQAPVAAVAKPKGNSTKNVSKPVAAKLPVDLVTPRFGDNETERAAFVKELVANTSDPEKGVSSYGPNSCVQTYLSKKGTCMMKTKCKAADIEGHEFGLTCVESGGATTRHLFGKDSFHPEEEFDTLIKCHLCLGLDASKIKSDAPKSLTATLKSLSDEVKELKTGMESMKEDVKKLNAEVFPAPAPAPKSLVIHKREHKRHVEVVDDAPAKHLRHHHSHRHHVEQKPHHRHHHHHRHHKHKQVPVTDDEEDAGW